MVSPAVFLFSGQGSQYFHMGSSLFDGNATFRSWMLRLDDVARQVAGASVIESLYSAARGKSDPFDRTLLSHPAIFMVEYALTQALVEAGVVPSMVLGVSVGSFAAAAVAGFLDVEDALTAVIRQAMALEESCEPGGMTAVLADPALYGEDFLGARTELAGVNFASHFVVSAKPADLAAAEGVLKQRGVTYQRLPVSFAFHSKWMDGARESFAAFMHNVPRRQGHLPLVCCDQTTIVNDLSNGFFWDVVRNPIRFRETIARLEAEGPRRYIDVGAAGTLATFLKYGLPKSTASTMHSILTPFGADQKNLAAVAAAVGH